MEGIVAQKQSQRRRHKPAHSGNKSIGKGDEMAKHYYNPSYKPEPGRNQAARIRLSDYKIHQPLCFEDGETKNSKLTIELTVFGSDFSAEKYQRILGAVEEAVELLTFAKNSKYDEFIEKSNEFIEKLLKA